MMLKPEAHILFSGGIDSLACAHYFKERGFAVRCVFLDYGQSARKAEINAASDLSAKLGLPLTLIKSSGTANFRNGELLGRNLFLISSALFHVPIERGLLIMGLHKGTPYYDCSAEFANRCDNLLSAMTDGLVRLECPFIEWSKAELFQYVVDERLPYESSYSCELLNDQPCGECASCRDRAGLHVLLNGDQ